MAAILALGNALGLNIANIIFRCLDESSVAGLFGATADDIAIIADAEYFEGGTECMIKPYNHMIEDFIYGESLEFSRS